MPTAAAAAPFVFILLWSGAFVAVRAGLPDVTPLWFLTARFAIAAAVLVLVSLLWRSVRRDWASFARTWPHFAVAGTLLNGGYLSGAYVALTEISGATMALLGALHPLLTALLSGPLLGDRFRPLQWLGFVLGTLGVAIVVGVNVIDFGHTRSIALGAAAVTCLVAGTLYYSRFCRTGGLVAANGIQLTASALFCAALTLLFEDARADWTPTALLTLAYLAFGASLGGMALYLFMLKTGTAGKVSANFYLIPGITALMGWGMLGETLTANALAGFAIAMLGLWLVQARGAARADARRVSR
jgi:drug/metabolite transporter (DMT)-like permease